MALDFFGEPVDSKRRSQRGGIYTSYLLGDRPSRLVHMILLDVRSGLDPECGAASDNQVCNLRLYSMLLSIHRRCVDMLAL